MSFSKVGLFGIVFLMLSFVTYDTFGQSEEEKIFPDWTKQAIGLWTENKISDSEFLSLVENMFQRNIIPDKPKYENSLDYIQTQIYDIPEIFDKNVYDKSNHEHIPTWIKDRAQWWIDGKISDIQFLRTIHYLKELGYITYVPETNTITDYEMPQSDLEKYLLSEKEILEITHETKWRTLSTERNFKEDDSTVDSISVLFTDITRVYEPIFYKFKVPSLYMQISEFDNKIDVDNYWSSFENRNKAKIFDSSYLQGSPNENSECVFNYLSEGAVTSCIYDNMIFHVVIFDEYGEHYNYNKNSLILNDDEPTTSFANEILKKISHYKKEPVTNPLYEILKNSSFDESTNNITEQILAPKSTETETSVIKGIQNFYCSRDDFGLVTIYGNFFNDGIKRDKTTLSIKFIDNLGNEIGKTSLVLNDLKEFESKRFVGHSKWSNSFHSCQINVTD